MDNSDDEKFLKSIYKITIDEKGKCVCKQGNKKTNKKSNGKKKMKLGKKSIFR